MNYSKIPITDTYHDIEKYIYKICWNFYKSSGTDFEEIRAEANYAFVKSHNKYNSKRGKYTTFIHHCIKNHLLATFVIKAKRNIKCNTNFNWSHITESQFEWKQFIEELPKDIQTVIRLIFDGPDGIVRAVGILGESKNHWKKVLRASLFDRGWSHIKVLNAFREIRNIL